MQISPGSPSGTSLPASSRIEISVEGMGRPMVPVNTAAASAGCRSPIGAGLGQAVALDEGTPGDLRSTCSATACCVAMPPPDRRSSGREKSSLAKFRIVERAR
jgi:hypothetical protein